ncbi:MAG: PQQ-dependent sugar dehydrogenase [Minisyncoccia bacterium]
MIINKSDFMVWSGYSKNQKIISILMVLFFCVLINFQKVHAQSSGFQESTVVTGLNTPTAMEFAPDGRLFVTEKSGSVRVIDNDQLLSIPFFSVSVDDSGERGLLGIAFDPDFSNNHYVYIYYTAPSPIHNRVSRITANGNLAVPGSEVVLMDMPNNGNASNHQGGAIHFGNDGKLYVAVGDNQQQSNVQVLTSTFGKMLRINKDGTIPTDNPFYSQTTGINRAIYAIGLRNPYTFAVDPVTGRIFVNDVGENMWEEINQLSAGANFGWPICEGPQNTGVGLCDDPSFTYPLHVYDHSLNGQGAITGGAFYHGSQFPSEYVGDYFFSDYSQGWIRYLESTNQILGVNNPSTSFWTGPFPVDLKVSSDGSLYYLSIGLGEVRKIQYSSGNLSPTAIIIATPTDGVSPLLVNFDASNSTDLDGDLLTYSWDFGDGSPLGSGVAPSHTYVASGLYTSVLTVSDGQGGEGVDNQIINVGTPPQASIINPINNTFYNAGNIISYIGTATDTEDGTLPASSYSWTITFHHETHTHPFLGPINGVTSGSFQIPQVGEKSPDVWYRITLTVTDSDGLEHTVFRDVFPNKVNITLSANYPGLTLTLDGQPSTTPITVQGVVGMSRSIGALSPQTKGLNQYYFTSWSDGGAQTHDITTPGISTVYSAVFQEVLPGPVTTNWLFPSTQLVDTGGGDGNGFEILPQNLLVNDGIYARDVNSGTNKNTSCTHSGKDRHYVRDFNISLPLGKNTVDGIEVRLDGFADSSSNSPKFCVRLSWDGGLTWTSAKSTPNLSTTEQTYILGNSSDKWGRSAWSLANLSNTSFRVRAISTASVITRDFSLDTVGVRITSH